MFPFFLDTAPVSPPKQCCVYGILATIYAPHYVSSVLCKKIKKVWKNSRRDAKPRGNPANHKNIVGGTGFSIHA